MSSFVAPSKDSSDFPLLQEGREAESPDDPDCVSLQGIATQLLVCFA